MKERRTATIMHNSYVTLFKHHYSVPKEYIGKRVDIVYNSETLEIFHGLRHVATHYRDDTPYGYTQKPHTTCPAAMEAMRRIWEKFSSVPHPSTTSCSCT